MKTINLKAISQLIVLICSDIYLKLSFRDKYTIILTYSRGLVKLEKIYNKKGPSE